jgi:hypothetical protein
MPINILSPNTKVSGMQNDHTRVATPLAPFAVGLSISASLLVFLGIATEVISIAILSFFPQGREPAGLDHSYYKDKPWAAEYFKEVQLTYRNQYRPYVVWRRAPFKGKYINVDENGMRRTVNPDCSPAARQIWMFGGSSLWGMGSPDDQTIPSVLSREYARSSGPVCVTNFGEAAWVSTQNVIQLEIALKHASRPPDFVLFYDGPADIAEVDQYGNADVHISFERTRQLLEAGQNRRSQLAYLKETGTYRLIATVMEKVAAMKTRSAPTRHPARNLDSLAKITVENYRANMKVLESLSAEYGFQYISFWSPWILIGNKPLCSPERSILDSITKATPYLPELSRKTYDMMFSVPDPHIINLSDTFDLTTSDTYLDRGHVTPDGNRLVALRILDVLKKSDREPALIH